MGLYGTVNMLYLCICVFVFVYLCMRHLVISVLISLDQELSENIWFVWSRTCYKGEKLRCHACDTHMVERYFFLPIDRLMDVNMCRTKFMITSYDDDDHCKLCEFFIKSLGLVHAFVSLTKSFCVIDHPKRVQM